MVVDKLSNLDADRLSAAFADPTRLDIRERSMIGPHTRHRRSHADYELRLAALQMSVAPSERAGLASTQRRACEELVESNDATRRDTAASPDSYDQP
jgi:hypothetical protein